MRVAFHTLGCKVNHYETEAMREAFVSRGAVSVGEEEAADVYIVNTCTVTNIADRKSRQYIRRMKKINPDALIVVTGCYAQVEPEEVAALPEVDMVVGNGQKSRICGLVLERFESRQNSGADIHVLSRNQLTEYEDMGIVASSEPGMTRAYIKIQEGCDRFCSYCLIPFARGPVRSRDPEEILQEARMLLDSGVREIVLTGINTALYGTETGSSCSLSDLLGMLDSIDREFRIRLSSLEPTVVDKDDVENIIPSCDVLILPSFSESFGLVLIEALACGKPVIGSDVGGISEIITKDVGLLVDPNNVVSIAKATDRILSDNDLRLIFSMNARNRALDFAAVDIPYDEVK